MNMTKEIVARLALFVAGARTIIASEPEMRFVLAGAERRTLAWTALGMFADAHDGYVSKDDIICAANMFALDKQDAVAISIDLFHALTDH